MFHHIDTIPAHYKWMDGWTACNSIAKCTQCTITVQWKLVCTSDVLKYYTGIVNNSTYWANIDTLQHTVSA